ALACRLTLQSPTRQFTRTGVKWERPASGRCSTLVPSEAAMSKRSPGVLATAEEVAQKLRLQPETVRQMAREARLPAYKVGRCWRFDAREVECWLRSHGPAAPPNPKTRPRCVEGVLPLFDEAPREANGSAFKDP